MRTTRLRITLRDVEPAVVRVIDVPTASSLAELHELFQVTLGWTDSHLHQFAADGVRYGVPDPDWDDLQVQEEAAVRLRDLPARFEYLYDFGDSWEHDVEVVGRGEETPGCVEGTGGCPPEDCGGAPGYEHLREVLADPRHEEHDELRKWVGELPSFDREATDLLVRQTVGEVPESVRLLLDLLAGGVKLTPGGRLPRSVVRAAQERRPDWYSLDRPASIEEDLFALADGRPLAEADYRKVLGEVSAGLRALDLLAGDWRTWEAGPSARTLLPRATALADLWTREPVW